MIHVPPVHCIVDRTRRSTCIASRPSPYGDLLGMSYSHFSSQFVHKWSSAPGNTIVGWSKSERKLLGIICTTIELPCFQQISRGRPINSMITSTCNNKDKCSFAPLRTDASFCFASSVFVHLYTNITSSFTFSILLRPFYLASIPLGAKLRHDMFRESKLPKRHQIGVQHTEEFLPFG